MAIRWILTLLLSLAAASALAAITGDVNDSLLLVVGDVTSSSARILLDQVPPSTTKLQVRVHKTMARNHEELAASTAFQTLELPQLTLAKRPQVVALRDLEPGRRYAVQLELDEPKETATVLFHTAREKAAVDGERWTDRVLVVSCDRYVDDHDDVLMERLARDVEAHDDAAGESSVHFGMAHLGDQIYADAGELSIKVAPFLLEEMKDATKRRDRYEAVLAQFRNIYRKTFGRKAAQRVLRVGAHWMLPDDHEIINNFNYELVQKAFQGPQNELLSEEERERLVALQLHCRAGLQAYYEFQYQLYHEFPWDSVDFLEDALGDIIRAYPVYFAVELQQLKLLFLDVRFERSFFDATQDLPKLVGNEQRRFLDGKLQMWSEVEQSAAVVFTSMPLFFQSAFSAAIAHVVEHETYPGMAKQRAGLEDLFRIFQVYNQQERIDEFSPLVRLLVGGDLHMMAHSRVCGTEGSNSGCLDQLITSGVTNGSTSIQDTKLIPYYFLITQLTHFAIRAVWHKWFKGHLQRLFGGSLFSDAKSPQSGAENESWGVSCAPSTEAATCLAIATKIFTTLQCGGAVSPSCNQDRHQGAMEMATTRVQDMSAKTRRTWYPPHVFKYPVPRREDMVNLRVSAQTPSHGGPGGPLVDKIFRQGASGPVNPLRSSQVPRHRGFGDPLVFSFHQGAMDKRWHLRVSSSKPPRDIGLRRPQRLQESIVSKLLTQIDDLFPPLITQLTPLFEIVYSWLRYIPVFSSLLPRSSPWHIEYDRVFFGRNYGILEYTADGNFNWNQTITEPYDEAYQRRVQSVIDASTPRALGFIALLIAVLNTSIFYRLLPRCSTKKNHKRSVKTTKTQ